MPYMGYFVIGHEESQVDHYGRDQVWVDVCKVPAVQRYFVPSGEGVSDAMARSPLVLCIPREWKKPIRGLLQ